MTTSKRDQLAAPFAAVSSTNHAAWPLATSCFLLVLSVMSVLAKIISRFKHSSVNLYDALLIAATLVALAQTVCIVLACKYGLGQHKRQLSDTSFELFAKFYYAASMLAVISQACSKASVTHFITVLSPHRVIALICRCVIVIIVLWVLTAVPALAAQCESPKQWIVAPGRCTNLKAVYIYVGVVNILTDVALIIIPMCLLTLVNFPGRWTVMALFSIRFVVVIFAGLSIASFASLFSSSSDISWDAVLPTLWLQFTLNLSIITACLPSLKRMLDAFGSGAAAVSILPPYEVAISKPLGFGWFKSKGGKDSTSKRGPGDPQAYDGNNGRRRSLQQDVNHTDSQSESAKKECESGFNRSRDIITNSDATVSRKSDDQHAEAHSHANSSLNLPCLSGNATMVV